MSVPRLARNCRSLCQNSIYLLGYPVMMIWRYANTIFMVPPSFAASFAGLVLVLGSLLVAGIVLTYTMENMTLEREI